MAFDAGSVVTHVKADLSDFQEGMKKVRNTIESVGDGFTGVRGKLEGFTGSIFNLKNLIIGAGVGLLAKDVIESGIAYDRLNKTLEVLAGNVGLSTDKLKDMRKALEETNTRGSDATQTMIRFIQSGLEGQVDFKKFIGVAKDFAASVGVSSAQGIDNLTQAIVTLRPELLDQFGIQFNLNNLYTEAALKSGKKVAALTQEEKRMALLNEVYRQGEKVQGVYAKTYDTAGKNILSIQDRISELKDFIGAILVPGLTKITNFIHDQLKSWVVFFEENQQLITDWGNTIAKFVDDAGAKIVEIFNALLPTLQKFGKWVLENKETIITFVTGLGIALGTLLILATITQLILALTNPITLVVLAIAALYTAWQTNFMGIRDVANQVIQEVITFFNEYLKPAIDAFVEHWATIWPFVQILLQGVWNIMLGIVQFFWNTIYGIVKVGLALMSGDWEKVWEAIIEMGTNNWNALKRIFQGILDYLFGFGATLTHRLVAPFEDAWNKIKDLLNKIKNALDFTKKHSPSVVDIVERGVHLVNRALEDLGGGINVTPQISPASATNNSNFTSVNIDMDGAIISNAQAAEEMGEKIGDSIIRKLQMNVRF